MRTLLAPRLPVLLLILVSATAAAADTIELADRIAGWRSSPSPTPWKHSSQSCCPLPARGAIARSSPCSCCSAA